jgi:ABC-2 type transport system ATP-binding protein
MEQPPSIEVEGLTKRYGPVDAIRDVSFSVRKGEVVGFLGPNGAGKTTTLRILCGLMRATSGRAHVCGVSLARDPIEVRRHIGYMPESNPLPEDLRVIEYLRLRGRLKELRGRRLRQRVDTVLELCDLNRKSRRKLIGSLSKGYRQRVGIADAIVAEPDVAILDEPTTGLDPHQVLLIRELLDSLRGSMTIILSSHILSEVEVSCDRVIIMNHGRVVASGTPDALRREFVQDLTYILEVSGELPPLVRALTQLDDTLTVMPASDRDAEGFMRLVIHSRKPEDLSEVILSHAQRVDGHRVRTLYRRQPTLEDVFLAATRRSWDITEDGGRNGRRFTPPTLHPGHRSAPPPGEPGPADPEPTERREPS